MKKTIVLFAVNIMLIACSKDEQIKDETSKGEQYNIEIEANTNVSVKDVMLAEDSVSVWILTQKTDISRKDTTIVIGNKKITIK